ncbi:MAG: hypothetical protein AAFR11_06140 [Pseudomonadota bacterium]
MASIGDYELKGGHVIAQTTGARIDLTPTLFRDIVRAMSFVGFVRALRALRYAQGRRARAKIAFFPLHPRTYYAVWPVCHLADVRIVKPDEDPDLFFFFEDSEFRTEAALPPAERPVFNGGCIDIRKSQVTRAFEETFGYGLAVDPTTYEGAAVEKSERNGVHDGRTIECPIASPVRDKVYQKLVDNTFDGTEYVDIRTPIVGGEIPFVYLKRRRPEDRFNNENRKVDLMETDALLTAAEVEKIQAFARAMNLDFGGLDVLRDRTDGRLYIVDVNKTDMGPPTALPGRQKLRAMRMLADSFARMVDERMGRI